MSERAAMADSLAVRPRGCQLAGISHRSFRGSTTTCSPRFAERVAGSRRTSVDGDGNALRLDARLLRDLNLEHAIGVARLDRFSLR